MTIPLATMPEIVLVLVSLGLLQVFFGHRLLRPVLASTGAVLVTVVASYAGHQLLGWGELQALLYGFAVGLVGGVLCYLLFVAGVVALGALLGALLAVLAWAAIGVPIAPLALGLAALAGATLALLRRRVVMIVGTAMVGATCVVAGLLLLLTDTPVLEVINDPTVLGRLRLFYLIDLALVAGAGIMIQFAFTAREPEAEARRDGPRVAVTTAARTPDAARPVRAAAPEDEDVPSPAPRRRDLDEALIEQAQAARAEKKLAAALAAAGQHPQSRTPTDTRTASTPGMALVEKAIAEILGDDGVGEVVAPPPEEDELEDAAMAVAEEAAVVDPSLLPRPQDLDAAAIEAAKSDRAMQKLDQALERYRSAPRIPMPELAAEGLERARGDEQTMVVDGPPTEEDAGVADPVSAGVLEPTLARKKLEGALARHEPERVEEAELFDEAEYLADPGEPTVVETSPAPREPEAAEASGGSAGERRIAEPAELEEREVESGARDGLPVSHLRSTARRASESPPPLPSAARSRRGPARHRRSAARGAPHRPPDATGGSSAPGRDGGSGEDG